MGGIGPAPFCAILLVDLGADVVRLDRVGPIDEEPTLAGAERVLLRGRRSLAVDLKHPAGAQVVLDLTAGADVLLGGFRPGVTERLGIGPDECLARNCRLVYGRVTGWGRIGPYADMASHDIKYIALAGALWPTGRRDSPPAPALKLIGDFGGGGMLLAVGLLASVFDAQHFGRGQVVDAAMVDGAALLTTMLHGFRSTGAWRDEREAKLLDGGAHFYDVYETADGRYVSIGPIEPHFYAELLRLLGLNDDELPVQYDREGWQEANERLAEVFRSRTRNEWCEILHGTNACSAPVLSMEEAPRHPHNVSRQVFVDTFGIVQPAPAPRFSWLASSLRRPPPHPGEHSREVLADWGFAEVRVTELHDTGVVGAAPANVVQ